jgi:hypothetical protein
MSKCQMNKYKAGGRCGGSGSGKPVLEGSGGGLGQSLSAMMAARDQQDSMWSSPSPPSAAPMQQQNQLVLQPKVAQDRKKDLEFILQGDFAD